MSKKSTKTLKEKRREKRDAASRESPMDQAVHPKRG